MAAPRAEAAVTMVPVRVVEMDDECVGSESVGAGPRSIAWTVRTPRGEVQVYASADHVGALRAAIAMLLGGGS